MAKKQYGMVIDLQKCVGCGACALGCKSENNTQARSGGQSFNWADFSFEAKGKFPNVQYTAMPVLCNHCTDAPCVKVCPVTPKAMFKTPDGITMHNDERCIGCRMCQKACPYSVSNLDKDKKAQYSVISANGDVVHAASKDTTELIKGCTSSGAELAKKAGAVIPNHHKYSHPDYESIRKPNVVEKCIFCAHRVAKGMEPTCVAVCPSKARLFGDLNDASSAPAQALKKFKGFRLKEEKKTKPNVYYVRSFKAAPKA